MCRRKELRIHILSHDQITIAKFFFDLQAFLTPPSTQNPVGSIPCPPSFCSAYMESDSYNLYHLTEHIALSSFSLPASPSFCTSCFHVTPSARRWISHPSSIVGKKQIPPAPVSSKVSPRPSFPPNLPYVHS